MERQGNRQTQPCFTLSLWGDCAPEEVPMRSSVRGSLQRKPASPEHSRQVPQQTENNHHHHKPWASSNKYEELGSCMS